MRPVIRSACATLVAAALAGAPPALADWPATPTVGVPVCVATGIQSNVVMSPDGTGGAWLAWTDYRVDWADLRYFTQHLDALGNADYAPDGVPLSAHRVPDGPPALASDGAGGAFAVWRDFRADTAGNLYAQRLTGADPAAWGANGLPVSTGPLHERQLVVAPDGAGGLFVAWSDDRDGVQWQVRAQHVSAAGALLWDPDGIEVAPWAALQMDPRLAADGEGGVLVAWTDQRGTAPNAYAQRLSGAGVPQWTAGGVLLSTATFGVALRAIASDGRGGAYAALLDNRSQNSWQQAFGQHVDRAGTIVWAGDGMPLSGPAWPVTDMSASGDGAGGAWLMWFDYENNGLNRVFAAHADSAGLAVGTAVAGSGQEGNHGFGAALAPDSEGGALVAWNGEDGDAHSVWAQRLDASLALLWGPAGTKTAHSTGRNHGVTVVDDGRGGAILGWRDDTPSWVGDLYAARLDRDGQPGTAGVPPAAAPAALALAAGPSPARAGGAVTLRLAMPAPGEARVTLLDVAGRRVAGLRGTAGAPGEIVLRWDGRDAGGRRVRAGLYFARAQAAGRAAFARIVVTD